MALFFLNSPLVSCFLASLPSHTPHQVAALRLGFFSHQVNPSFQAILRHYYFYLCTIHMGSKNNFYLSLLCSWGTPSPSISASVLIVGDRIRAISTFLKLLLYMGLGCQTTGAVGKNGISVLDMIVIRLCIEEKR